MGSKTHGHPEYHPDIGIEATTGPLGQGITNAANLIVIYDDNHITIDGDTGKESILA